MILTPPLADTLGAYTRIKPESSSEGRRESCSDTRSAAAAAPQDCVAWGQLASQEHRPVFLGTSLEDVLSAQAARLWGGQTHDRGAQLRVGELPDTLGLWPQTRWFPPASAPTEVGQDTAGWRPAPPPPESGEIAEPQVPVSPSRPFNAAVSQVTNGHNLAKVMGCIVTQLGRTPTRPALGPHPNLGRFPSA